MRHRDQCQRHRMPPFERFDHHWHASVAVETSWVKSKLQGLEQNFSEAVRYEGSERSDS
jgi:hypothetical protein